jgi:hypothetical protein
MPTTSGADALGEYGASDFISKPVDYDFEKEQLRQLPTTPA